MPKRSALKPLRRVEAIGRVVAALALAPVALPARGQAAADEPARQILESIRTLQADPEALERAIATLAWRLERLQAEAAASRTEEPSAPTPASAVARLRLELEGIERRLEALAQAIEALGQGRAAEIPSVAPPTTLSPADQRRPLEALMDVLRALAREAGAGVETLKVGPTPGVAAAAFPPEALEFFERRIRPILVEHCQSCHGPEKQKSGLRLDTREAVLRGGSMGPAVIPGDPPGSRLIQAVRHQGELKMPAEADPLPQEAIRALEDWVRIGLPWPAEGEPSVASEPPTAEAAIARARQTHWAFRPVRRPPVPAARDETWARTPIDSFIRARLEERGLEPSPPADRRTLIRRAYFDLIGLPPTAEEIRAFVEDPDPRAFEGVVDRLLASPRYGERWGRHWLDVARYADTKGYLFEEERAFAFSYTYRDYVIAAFNEDKPFDRFVIEQIAADLLPLGEDKTPLAALGFLTLGRRFLNNVHDITDDRIDVVTRGFLGLTVSCARCHDHKYDPIPSEDYYSLYGVFRGAVEPPEPPFLREPEPSPEYEAYQRELEEREAAYRTYRADRWVGVLAELRARVGDYLLAAHETLGLAEEDAFQAYARDRKLHPPAIRAWQKRLEAASETPHDPIWAPWRALAALPDDEFTTRAAPLAAALARNAEGDRPLNPLLARAFEGPPPASMKEVAERYGRLLTEADRHWAVMLQGQAQIAAQENAPTAEPPTALPDPAEEALRQVLYAADSPVNIRDGQLETYLDLETLAELRRRRTAIDRVKSTHPGRPPRAMALVEADKPFDPYVFVRGSPGNKGPEVPRRFLAVLSPGQRRPFERGSGRLELAEAIASQENPLTARVLVNRVWLLHFGRGLVDTPSDFGLRSEPPTHPELLDWLADAFVAGGWSLKRLHRLILLSAVYQQAGADRAAARAVDPENRLLWRFPRGRLDFEAMRDSLLQVAGVLDLKMGGPPVELTEPPFPTRRTVYGFVERQNLPALFRTFDFANPDAHSPQRFTTTVPQQALFLMNSSFVAELARKLAGREEARASATAGDRLRALYRLALSREPSEEELTSAARFILAQGWLGPPPPEPPPVWRYGYGEYDAEAKSLISFAPLPHFADGQWRGGPQMPDPTLGWLMLNRGGGHPGGDAAHAVIRRWVAPREAVVAVEGTLRHPSEQGDGVLAYVFSSREGELGRWAARNGETAAEVTRAEVRRGDTLDFIVGCGGDESFDNFQWAPTIRVIEERAAAAVIGAGEIEWNARAGFQGPPPPRPTPLDPWAELAQALLMTNEFMFVD